LQLVYIAFGVPLRSCHEISFLFKKKDFKNPACRNFQALSAPKRHQLDMAKRCAENLPASHAPPSAQKPRLALGLSVAQTVHDLTALCGRKDGVEEGHFLLRGLVVPIWAPDRIVSCMTTTQMHGVIQDMQQYLQVLP
jgi:hypothetical protein